MAKSGRKKTVVAVSGGFDPLHVGHIKLFRAAKKNGDELLVILNNDNWLRQKKGFAFMPQRERKALIQAIAAVDRVIVSRHPKRPKDMSVSRELLLARPDIFANGGDRNIKNIPEAETCRKIGCRMIFGIGGNWKIQSSSKLLSGYLKKSQTGRRI